MNIAFAVIKHINRGGGIEKYTYELGTRLVARGHNVRVYSMRHFGDVEPSVNGMEIVPVPSVPLPQMQKLSASLWSCCHAATTGWADIVHLHHVGPGAMAWYLRMHNKPTLIQYHGLEWKRSRWGMVGQGILKALEKWSVLVNNNFTAVSLEQCEYFRDQYRLKAHYIPTGAEIKQHTPAEEILKLGLVPKQYVLFASRLVREKGAHYLIPAFRRLRTDCKLVIAGDAQGSEAYKRELMEMAGDDQRIIFPGFVEGRLLDELFSHAAVYVQPSEIEGLSIALLEAMSYGLCCLVSDIPENREAIASCGFTFRNKDPYDLANKLGYLLNNEYVAQQVADQAIRHIRDNYSWDRIADDFEQLYTLLATDGVESPVMSG